MTATLLLQARTNSSRLPGKVLLPVEGMPLVVLAALRAGNTGHHVVVVTSQEPSDDALCAVLDHWDIDYYRGDLEDTLKRFVDALKAVPDEQPIVRLTSDNVVPDGAFIDELLGDFRERRLEYLCCSGAGSGLPYGVSAEVTRAGHLREAHIQAVTAFDREHVTPKIIERFGRSLFERYGHVAMSQYRCTVDTLDDYLQLCRMFKGLSTPEQAPMDQLLEKLKQASAEVFVSQLANRMVLGTAQFGQPYGVANTCGQPTQEQVNNLVQTAIANGVQYLDTARAYGESEEVLGRALLGGWSSRATVITKMSPLDDCPSDAEANTVNAYVEQSVFKSCHALRLQSLDVLMLHRAEHLTARQGAIWNALCDLKKQKRIGRLGVSVQSPDEALFALDFEDVEFIQLPFNILDNRWDAVIEKISQVRAHRPLVVHVRSSLLQGLLTTDRIDVWQRACCANAAELIAWLRSKAEIYTSGRVVDLAIRYVCSQTWVDGVVIGVETRDQLIENLCIVNAESWSEAVLRQIAADRPTVSLETLNPAKWKQ